MKALEIALVLSMSIGFGMIVVAVRGPRRVRLGVPERKRLGIIGAVAFVVSIIAWMETEASRNAARATKGAPPPIEHRTDQRFESASPPSLKVEAPDGWRIAYDESSQRLSVVAGDPPTTLMVVFTRQLEPGGTPEGVRNEVKKQLQNPVEFAETIDAAPALGITSSDATTASWAIDRGGGLVSVIQCRADHDARTACRPVLDRLRWLTPLR